MKWRCVIHSRCRISSATDNGLCFSTASAITSGGPITSHSGAEALLELGAEALEEIDVLGLLPGELQEGAAARVVAGKAGAHVVEQEGQDELLDQAELVEIAVAADLVQQQLLARRQAVERRDAGERLGHERLVKI